MQFVKNGPDIPENLLQAHEDGRVVFFCGAGISYPAGLPGFRGLVDKIYTTVGTVRTAIEEQVYSREQYDATLDLLERRLPGQRGAVRSALFKVLKPNLRLKGAIDTHTALLQLARGRDDGVRLVTTNFDRIFQRLMVRVKPAIPAYPAPFLPIPKNSRWDGVVYLHGLLPEKPNEGDLNRLVLTSGDFGLAYLTEGWAARFVSELFRNYIVCFVGYSINDPVLRYMMDALAADRMLGEITPQAYALGDFQETQKDDKLTEWEAKGVTPILYEVPAATHDHSLLHRTLKAWAETYRDGVRGKERIVAEYAMTRPLASTRQDDFVGRMLWALSHNSGLPAKRFATFDPAPSLDWLEPLSQAHYRQADLPRFGVLPGPQHDDKLAFSLTRRPSPYTHAQWMVLVQDNGAGSQWDDVMFYLARWLIRHLDDPELVLWLAKQGGQLHDRFAGLIEHRLDQLAQLERENKTDELERIRSHAPKAIPQPLMRTLWRFLLTGRIKNPRRNLDLFQWKRRLKRDGLSASLRLELRELLAPRVLLRKPFRWGDEAATTTEAKQLKELVELEFVLSADHAHSSLKDLQNSETWHIALPNLLEDIQQLLNDTLDLMSELGESSDKDDRSFWDLPSITPHWQNRGFRDWVVLIELLRDAWLAVREHDPIRALHTAQGWWSRPYLTFKRLALFAATYDNVAPDGQWVDWLRADDSWWLWSVGTQRETMRVLVLQGARIPAAMRTRLEEGILVGPPREMFRDDLTAERWQEIVDHSVWLRLAKLASGGMPLGDKATQRLTLLIAAHPQWSLAENERDEFSHWMSGTGDPDYEDRREIDRAPRLRRELVKWLQRSPSTHLFHEDDWRDFCRERFATATSALYSLSLENQWPSERWREALQAWSNEKLARRSWRHVAPILQHMPNDVLLSIAHSAAWWLEAAAKVLDQHEAIFFDLCHRLLMMKHQDSMDGDQPVTQAINHPVGQVTQALLQYWFRSEPEDNQGLPANLKTIATALCDTRVDQYRHGRVLLATHVIAIFRVDPEWTTATLLPLFNWRSSNAEARAVWEGFLWSPRLYRPLLQAFKGSFLDTAKHYNKLAEYNRQYAAMFTYAALDPADTFTTAELHEAANALPQEGLEESARTLVSALQGAGEQRQEQWKNRIQPYWQTIWPKSRQLASSAIAEQLTHLVIATQDAFPEALATVRNWLQPVEHSYYVVHLLRESGLCARFPKESLALLDAIIENQSWPPDDLGECLTVIAQNFPKFSQENRYQRLMDYSRRHEH